MTLAFGSGNADPANLLSFSGEPPESVHSFRRFSWSSYCSGAIGVDSANRLHRAVKLSKSIRLDLLQLALSTLALHRDAVRARVENVAGEPVLHFDVRPQFEWTIRAGEDAAAVLSALVWRPFDFDREGLFRCLLAEIDGEIYMAIAMHHLVSDAISFGLVWSEFWRNYWTLARGAEPAPPRATAYGSYLSGLNTWRKTPQGQAQIADLATRIAPFTQGRPASPAHPPVPTPIRIEGDLLFKLRLAAAEAKVTLFSLLLAAQAGALLEIRPDQPALIACVHSGRDHPALLGTVGYLADRSFYLIAAEDDASPGALVDATWRAVADVAKHRFVRFDFLRDHLAAVGGDLVTPNFNFAAMARSREHGRPTGLSSPPSRPLFWSVKLSPCPVFSGSGADTCDYALALGETLDGLAGAWSPKTPSDAVMAERFMFQLQRLAMLARPA